MKEPSRWGRYDAARHVIIISSPVNAMGAGFLFTAAVAQAAGHTWAAWVLTRVAILMLGVHRAIAYGMYAAPFVRFAMARHG